MSSARDNILARLRANAPQVADEVADTAGPPVAELSRDERVAKLKRLMEAMRGVFSGYPPAPAPALAPPSKP